MFTENYRVVFEVFSKRHYIKEFEKKYKSQWLETRKVIVVQLSHVDSSVSSGRTNPPIHRTPDNKSWIIKHEFAVAGRKESPKSSGNRLIAHVDHELKTVRVLFVFHKNHVMGNSETAFWRKVIKENYPELARLFSL